MIVMSHNNKMTLQLMEAKEMEGLIRKSRKLIAAADQAQLQQADFEIQLALDREIVEIKKPLVASASGAFSSQYML